MDAIKLPDYLQQSAAVKQRFAAIKRREVILEVKALQKIFSGPGGAVTALQNINFKAHRREFVCVIGASGCGKSTLIRILAGLETASAGEVLLDGKPVSGAGAGQRHGLSGLYIIPLADGKEKRDVWLAQPGHGFCRRRKGGVTMD